MADKEVVIPPVDDLVSYGQKLVDWSRDLLSVYGKSMVFRITPGQIPTGVALKLRFEDATKGFQTGLKTLGDVLFTTGNEIIKVAKNYQTTEDGNKADIDRLRDLVDAVKPYAPEVEQIMPPDPPLPYGGGYGDGYGGGAPADGGDASKGPPI